MDNYIRYVWILWDLSAVAVLAYFIWTSAAHGFIRTLIRLLGYVLAVAAARMGSPILAQLVYDAVVRDALRVVLMNRLEDMLIQGGAAVGDILDQIPGSLQRIIDGDLLGSAILGQTAGAALESEAAGMVEVLIDAALRDPILSILQGMFFLLLFTLASLLVRHFSGLFRGIYRIPVIGPLNTALGGIVGAFQACLALFVAAMAVQLVILFTGGGFSWMNARVMDDTFVFRVFYNLFTL